MIYVSSESSGLILVEFQPSLWTTEDLDREIAKLVHICQHSNNRIILFLGSLERKAQNSQPGYMWLLRFVRLIIQNSDTIRNSCSRCIVYSPDDMYATYITKAANFMSNHKLLICTDKQEALNAALMYLNQTESSQTQTSQAIKSN